MPRAPIGQGCDLLRGDRRPTVLWAALFDPGGPPALSVTPFSYDLIEAFASDHVAQVTDLVDAQLVCGRGGGVRS